MKKLVAFFSASGVTKKVAEDLALAAGADIFEIEPEIPYTTEDLDWRNKSSRSSVEMNDQASRPAIHKTLENMDEYGVVFIGFPVWWYIAPTIINTFLESYDFSLKTIILFCTSGGSGLGKSEQVLKDLCPPTTNWKPGKLLNKYDKESLADWVNSLDLTD
ncbi:MAG: flavodoxin [Eubacteriaceae bacterium]|nr:flavodoxin [Eubacteriaceae bacterium]